MISVSAELLRGPPGIYSFRARRPWFSDWLSLPLSLSLSLSGMMGQSCGKRNLFHIVGTKFLQLGRLVDEILFSEKRWFQTRFYCYTKAVEKKWNVDTILTTWGKIIITQQARFLPSFRIPQYRQLLSRQHFEIIDRPILPFFFSSFPWGFWERSMVRRLEDVFALWVSSWISSIRDYASEQCCITISATWNGWNRTTNLSSLSNTLSVQFVRQTIIGLQSQQLNFVVQKFHSGDELFPIYFSLRSKICGRCFRFEAPHSILTNVLTWENINMCWPFLIYCMYRVV